MRNKTEDTVGHIEVLGERARKYTIWRPGDDERELPGGLPNDFSTPLLLEIGAHAWIVPTSSLTKPHGIVDTKAAVAGLLACDMDFRNWLRAREQKWMQLSLTGTKGGYRPTAEMRRLSTQNKNRRQRFDLRLAKWATEFGPPGLREDGGPDIVDNVMRAAYCIRAWVLPDSPHIPPRTGTFLLDDLNPVDEINEGAGQCNRNPRSGAWTAPTLWAAMCRGVQYAREYGWSFGECAADDCYNVFLKKRADQLMCSQRCGKRKRDHEKRDQPNQ
jgi:hypothetical protein